MKKVTYVLLALILFSISLSFICSATLDKPANSAIISGTSALNATNASTTITMIANCSFYAKSASTANSTWTLLGTFINDTSTRVNGTFNSAILQDSNNYIFNASCINKTGGLRVDAVTTSSITIDNTIPQIPTISPSTNTDSPTTATTTQTFTGTVIDANTTACTYVISRGGASSGNDYFTDSGSYSGTSCTFTKTFTNSLDNGLWYWTVTASDGTNTTSSGSNIYNVNIQASGGGGGDGDGGGTIIGTGTGSETTSSNSIAYLIIGLILAVIIGYAIYSKS